ncbi:MAG: glycosyltransferase [Verrucomicrobiota bacterium]
MPLEHRILVVFPFPGQTTAGGPEGFISQLLRPFTFEGLAVSPVSVVTGARVARRLRQLSAWISGRAQRWKMSTAEVVAREELFHAAGLDRVKFLWFMDQGVYQIFEPFVSPGQTVLYQPHCPELPWEEIPADTPEGARRRREAEACTRRLMQRADIVVLPNAGVRPIYAPILRPDCEVLYLQSGAARPAAVRPLPLDPQFTYLLYIGRRLPIKGFDAVLAAFQRAHAQRPDLRLILCGTGERPDHPGVIDVGFTSRVHDWIATADYVINANRQSYLDLSVMETLAIGTPLLMTCTHGHEIFRPWAGPGLRCLDAATPEALLPVLLECSAGQARRPAVRAGNRELYAREFAVDRYHARLAAFVGRVLGHPAAAAPLP